MALQAALQSLGQPGGPVTHAFSATQGQPPNPNVRSLNLSNYYLVLLKLGHFDDLGRFNAAGRALAPPISYPLPTPLNTLQFNPDTYEFGDPDDDKTDYRDDLYEYNAENLPDELYILKRPSNHVSRKELRPLQLKQYKIYGEYVRDVPCLPDHISSHVPGYLLEFWSRLEPRCELEDILDRIDPIHRPKCRGSTLPMRRCRFRKDYNLLSWQKASNWQLEETRMLELVAKKAIDLALNTTRGLTPGLVNPANGQGSKRISFPHTKSGNNDNCCDIPSTALSRQRLRETGLSDLWVYPGLVHTIPSATSTLQSIQTARRIRHDAVTTRPTASIPVSIMNPMRRHSTSNWGSFNLRGSANLEPGFAALIDTTSKGASIQDSQTGLHKTHPSSTMMDHGRPKPRSISDHELTGQALGLYTPFASPKVHSSPLESATLPHDKSIPAAQMVASSCSMRTAQPNHDLRPQAFRLGPESGSRGTHLSSPILPPSHSLLSQDALQRRVIPSSARPLSSFSSHRAPTVGMRATKRRSEFENENTHGTRVSFGSWAPVKRSKAEDAQRGREHQSRTQNNTDADFGLAVGKRKDASLGIISRDNEKENCDPQGLAEYSKISGPNVENTCGGSTCTKEGRIEGLDHKDDSHHPKTQDFHRTFDNVLDASTEQ